MKTISDSEKIIDTNNFEQRVAKKAYELFVNRGFKSGHDWDDWFEAQRQVESELNIVDRDCIRSESFYKTSHQSSAFPSEIDTQKINTSPFVKDF